jgi:hypothetical protein
VSIEALPLVDDTESALARTLHRIDRVTELADGEEVVAPTDAAQSCARAVIQTAASLLNVPFPLGHASDDGDGGLIVGWGPAESDAFVSLRIDAAGKMTLFWHGSKGIEARSDPTPMHLTDRLQTYVRE